MSQAVGNSGKYEYITSYDSPKHNGNAAIRCIVVHHWGDKSYTWDGVLSSLCNPSTDGSAHYMLEDGKVACLIAPGLRAWHVASNAYQNVMLGVWDINANSIGIECRPLCTKGDVDTLVQLIADLWQDYGKVPVYGHKQFMATQCPGDYFPLLDEIVERAEKIYYGLDEEQEEVEEMQFTEAEAKWLKQLYANSTKTACSDWAAGEMAEAQGVGITTGERPQDVATREEVACMVLRASKKL